MASLNSYTSTSESNIVFRYFIHKSWSSIGKCFSDRYFKANIVYLVYSLLLLHIDLNIGRESASDTFYILLGYMHILNGEWASETVYPSVSQSVSQTLSHSVSRWLLLSDLSLSLRLWHSHSLSSAWYIQSLTINSLYHHITFFSFVKTSAERLSILNYVTVCMHMTLYLTIDWLLLHYIMTQS